MKIYQPQVDQWIRFYRLMLTIRRFDEMREELAAEFPTPQQHPHFGQEAVSVGAVTALRSEDYILGTHRCIGQAIARGGDLRRLAAELFGKISGYAGGRAGEMSFQSKGLHMLASGVVGNMIPVASGLGLASQLKRTGAVCLCFFGDGAVNTGLFHEGVNLAAVWGLPVVFLCENNQFGLTTHISRATKVARLADKAYVYGIPGITVDGMDVLAVYGMVGEAIERARRGQGPVFVECLTYRCGGYNVFTDPNQGIGLYRTADEVEAWKVRCPIASFEAKLVRQGLLTQPEAETIDAAIGREIQEAVDFARTSSEPSQDSILEGVFSKAKPLTMIPKFSRTTSTRELNFRDAIREALVEEMLRDERVFLLGEEIGLKGGIFGVTRGLVDEFGPERVRDTPISEGAILGAAVGAALGGLRPVAEIMIVDFIGCGGAMAILLNEMSTIPYLGMSCWPLPVVVRISCGSRYPFVSPGAHHNGCLDALFTNIPCLKVAVPSTPFDAKGLLKTAIRDDEPVIFLEHKHLYTGKGNKHFGSLVDDYPGVVSTVPVEDYALPFGKADVKRTGSDVTVVATMMMVHKALKVARELEKEGISLEVIDPRTLVPFDSETVVQSVAKTGRLLVATEDGWRNGSGAGIVGQLLEAVFPYLQAPIRRIAALDVPIPYGHTLEGTAIPQESDFTRVVRELLA